MKPLHVGIIGFGRIGAEHATWMRAADGVEPAAVADETPARRAVAESRGLRTFTSVDELLNDNAIDAVLIATPTSMHFDHAMAALAAGKHVMIEKPMAMDLQQSAKLVKEGLSRKRVLSVFQNRRWDADYLAVKSLIASGSLGRVINVESRLGQWGSCVGPAAKEYRPNWRNEKSFGGGGLFDWGSHFVDQLWRLMLPAKPVRVFAQLRGNVWSSDCDDFARVIIDFDGGENGGAVGLVEINTTTTRPLPRWHLDGTGGSADGPYSLAFDTAEWARLTFTPAGESEPMAVVLGEPATRLTESQIWQQFAAATRGEGEPAVAAESVLPTMLLLDAARESSRLGTSINIKM